MKTIELQGPIAHSPNYGTNTTVLYESADPCSGGGFESLKGVRQYSIGVCVCVWMMVLRGWKAKGGIWAICERGVCLVIYKNLSI